MSYLSPLTPSIEATRFQLERSISVLEQKLRQRKELDIDIEVLENEKLAKRYQLASYYQDANYRASYNQLPIRSPYIADRYAAEHTRYILEEQQKNAIHLNRIRQLELEAAQLSKQKMRSTISFFGDQYPPTDFYPTANPYSLGHRFDYIAYEEDDTLIRKYQDGTRAQQIRNELDSYGNSRSNTRGSQELYRPPISRPLASDFSPQKFSPDRNSKYSSAHKTGVIHNHPGQHGGNLDPTKDPKQSHLTTSHPTFNPHPQSSSKNGLHLQRSPYDKLNYETDRKNDPNLSIFNNEGIRSSPRDQPNNAQQEETKTFKPSHESGLNRSGSNAKRTASFKNLNASQQNNANVSIINKQWKPNSSRKPASKSPLRHSAINRSRSRSRSGFQTIDESANQKIKNRLKLSQIVFEDSKFRNVKHEMSHLQMTYDNELKIRKEIKDKINNHPVILRKHAMVVE